SQHSINSHNVNASSSGPFLSKSTSLASFSSGPLLPSSSSLSSRRSERMLSGDSETSSSFSSSPSPSSSSSSSSSNPGLMDNGNGIRSPSMESAPPFALGLVQSLPDSLSLAFSLLLHSFTISLSAIFKSTLSGVSQHSINSHNVNASSSGPFLSKSTSLASFSSGPLLPSSSSLSSRRSERMLSGDSETSSSFSSSSYSSSEYLRSQASDFGTPHIILSQKFMEGCSSAVKTCIIAKQAYLKRSKGKEWKDNKTTSDGDDSVTSDITQHPTDKSTLLSTIVHFFSVVSAVPMYKSMIESIDIIELLLATIGVFSSHSKLLKYSLGVFINLSNNSKNNKRLLSSETSMDILIHNCLLSPIPSISSLSLRVLCNLSLDDGVRISLCKMGAHLWMEKLIERVVISDEFKGLMTSSGSGDHGDAGSAGTEETTSERYDSVRSALGTPRHVTGRMRSLRLGVGEQSNIEDKIAALKTVSIPGMTPSLFDYLDVLKFSLRLLSVLVQPALTQNDTKNTLVFPCPVMFSTIESVSKCLFSLPLDLLYNDIIVECFRCLCVITTINSAQTMKISPATVVAYGIASPHSIIPPPSDEAVLEHQLSQECMSKLLRDASEIRFIPQTGFGVRVRPLPIPLSDSLATVYFDIINSSGNRKRISEFVYMFVYKTVVELAGTVHKKDTDKQRINSDYHPKRERAQRSKSSPGNGAFEIFIDDPEIEQSISSGLEALPFFLLLWLDIITSHPKVCSTLSGLLSPLSSSLLSLVSLISHSTVSQSMGSASIAALGTREVIVQESIRKLLTLTTDNTIIITRLCNACPEQVAQLSSGPKPILFQAMQLILDNSANFFAKLFPVFASNLSFESFRVFLALPALFAYTFTFILRAGGTSISTKHIVDKLSLILSLSLTALGDVSQGEHSADRIQGISVIFQSAYSSLSTLSLCTAGGEKVERQHLVLASLSTDPILRLFGVRALVSGKWSQSERVSINSSLKNFPMYSSSTSFKRHMKSVVTAAASLAGLWVKQWKEDMK
ncbi:hypothetical protein ADUPG1_008690, partial [Aduncisulcus paluster]